MKNILYRTFCGLFAVLILVTSTGFGLVEHSCHIHGKRTHLQLLQKNQHSIKAEAAVKEGIQKQKCCDEDTRYENVPTNSIVENLAKTVKAGVVYFCELVIAGIVHFFESLLENASSTSLKEGKILFGRKLLSFINAYLI